MNKGTNLSERYKIEEMISQGYSSGAISEELGYSVSTIKKWRKRIREGLYDSQLGRPAKGALSSFDPLIAVQIDLMKDKKPGWGPARVLVELGSGRWGFHKALPSRSAIARYLNTQGYTRSYETHGGVAPVVCDPSSAPHDLWEMDAQGPQAVKGVGFVSLINLKDTYSGSYVMSFPVVVKHQRSQPATEAYQLSLRFSFSQWGLPKQVQVDHDSVFFDNTSPSPYPTRLHLWLIALGINLCYSRIYRPTDQARVERAHQTLSAHTMQQQGFRSWNHLFDHLQQERKTLNEEFPSQSLGDKAPLEAYPQARHSTRAYFPQKENELIDLDKIYQFLQTGRWFRKTSKDKTLSLGGNIYYLKYAKPREQIKIEFDAHSKYLLFYDDKERVVDLAPIKGIDKHILMGCLCPEKLLPDFQLTIPLNHTFHMHNQRVRLFET